MKIRDDLRHGRYRDIRTVEVAEGLDAFLDFLNSGPYGGGKVATRTNRFAVEAWELFTKTGESHFGWRTFSLVTNTGEARDMGYERGVSAGSWVIDGNTDADTIRRITKGYEDGDPEVMDMEPSPLSGEWADDPAIADVLPELGIDVDDDEVPDLLDEYESGFSEGFWESVLTSARFHLR